MNTETGKDHAARIRATRADRQRQALAGHLNHTNPAPIIVLCAGTILALATLAAVTLAWIF